MDELFAKLFATLRFACALKYIMVVLSLFGASARLVSNCSARNSRWVERIEMYQDIRSVGTVLVNFERVSFLKERSNIWFCLIFYPPAVPDGTLAERLAGIDKKETLIITYFRVQPIFHRVPLKLIYSHLKG